MRNTTKRCRKVVIMFLAISFVLCLTVQSAAQVSNDRTASPSSREALLIDRIEKLERRLAELETKLNAKAPSSIETVASSPEVEAGPPAQTDKAEVSAFEFITDTTFNVTFDGYYY